jgi:hypothetical protein
MIKDSVCSASSAHVRQCPTLRPPQIEIRRALRVTVSPS